MIIKTVIEEVRAIVGAINDIRGFLNARRTRKAIALSGKWTNEGDATLELPSHFIDLEISVEGKSVSGIVCSRNLQSGANLPNGSVVGTMNRGRILAEIIDVSRGRLLKFGDLTLRLKNGKLAWKCKNIIADFVPSSAQLWRL